MEKIISMYKEKGRAIILIYGVIGSDTDETDIDTTERKIATQLQEMGDISEIEIRINSPGGIVYDGIAIYNILKNHNAKKTVYIDGLAASIATVIAMVGDEIIMGKGTTFMIHNPSTITGGESKDFKKAANTLEKHEENMLDIYSGKNKKITREQIRTLMQEETFMTAEEAVKLGFATSIVDEGQNINGFNSKAIVALNREYNKKNGGGVEMSKYTGIAEAIAKAVKASLEKDPEEKKGSKENIIATVEGGKDKIVADQEMKELVAEVAKSVLAVFTEKEEKPEEKLVAKILTGLGITAKKEEKKNNIDEETLSQTIAQAVVQAIAAKKDDEKNDFFANFTKESKRADADILGKIENSHGKEISAEKISAEIISDIVAMANGK